MSHMRVKADEITLHEGAYVMYDGALYTGEVVDTADDGTVLALNTYRDGVENGPQREFYEDGSPKTAYQAVNGMTVGEAQDWHVDGRLARRQEFDQYGELRKRDVWDEEGVLDPDEAVDNWPVGDYPK